MTAAERAAEVLRNVKWVDIPWDAYVAALMADPDLLVDLAIEAGGLEHATIPEWDHSPSPVDGKVNTDPLLLWLFNDRGRADVIAGPAPTGAVPLYRRTPEADR